MTSHNLNLPYYKYLTAAFLICSAALSVQIAFANENTPGAGNGVPVNVDNFARAETAFQIDRILQRSGGLNQWSHSRQPTPLDKQNIIRMNRDTLYSVAVVDISKGATLSLPDSGERYLSVMVVNEDHYINKIYHDAGTYLLTEAEFDTPYVIVVARVLADPNDAEDLKAANALQDKVKIITDSAKPYSHPDYDRESYAETYKLLLGLAKGLPDAQRTFGKKEEVSQIRHLLGTAAGWGGLPVYEAFYVSRREGCRAGDFQLTVKDVPVDAFWSISIYNKAGYFEENKFDSYSINSVTAKPDEDGSVTVNFGTKPDGMDNFLYVMDGCSYVIRLYQPHDEVLNGQWTFPEMQPIYYDD